MALFYAEPPTQGPFVPGALSGGTPVSLTVPLSTVTVAPLTPSVAAPVNVAVPLSTVTVAPLTPSVSAPVNIAAPLSTVTVAPRTPSVSAPVNVAVPLSNVAVAAPTPSVTTSSGAVTLSVPKTNVLVTAVAPALTILHSTTLFTPPCPQRIPPWLPTTKPAHRIPLKHSATRGTNIFKLTNGTITTTMPSSWEQVAFAYYSGHIYQVTASEAAALTAAGYGAYLT